MLGSDTSEETWRALDERVNTYPTKRSFKGGLRCLLTGAFTGLCAKDANLQITFVVGRGVFWTTLAVRKGDASSYKAFLCCCWRCTWAGQCNIKGLICGAYICVEASVSVGEGVAASLRCAAEAQCMRLPEYDVCKRMHVEGAMETSSLGGSLLCRVAAFPAALLKVIVQTP